MFAVDWLFIDFCTKKFSVDCLHPTDHEESSGMNHKLFEHFADLSDIEFKE
jgi:hypothetical protein